MTNDSGTDAAANWQRSGEAVRKDASFDTYDDDLTWIIDKLADRAGASFGLIFRCVAEEPECVLMASAIRDGAWPTLMSAQLAQAIRQHSAEEGQIGEVRYLETAALPEQSDPVRILYMTFVPAPSLVIVAAVCRTESSFNFMHEAVARRLHPVLARYIHLWWLHRTERRRAEALSRVLDLSDLGVALFDRRGDLVFANSAVRKLLDQRDGLQRTGHSVSPVHEDDAQRYQAALQQAIRANQDRSTGVKPLTLSLRRDGTHRDLLLMSVSLDSVAIDPTDAASILYVVNPEWDVHGTLMPACRLYRLTGVESRLVEQLVAGASLAEAATRIEVGQQTARTYLKQIFRKTATKRQSDLIRVMLSSALKISVRVSSS